MDTLKEFNKKIYDRYVLCDNKEVLSSPNLVSSQRMENMVKPNPILYIGQETNEWVNYNKEISDITLDDIEKRYDEFLIDYGTTKTKFWLYISKILDVDCSQLYKNMIWSNTYLFGNRRSRGTAPLNENEYNMSIENLTFLYKYFNPTYTIFVAGNNHVYEKAIKDFLKNINSSLNKPERNNPIKIDTTNKVIWTYHPMRLNYIGEFNNTIDKIKTLI